MPRDTAHKRAIRALGCAVLAVFFFGFTSGPVRTCFSHPGHASGQHASGGTLEHTDTHHGSTASDWTPTAEHEGCNCLGRCTVEPAPYLSGADLRTQIFTPHAPKTLIAVRGRAHAKHDQTGLHLARPPPAVI
jgi:hypothetical protein